MVSTVVQDAVSVSEMTTQLVTLEETSDDRNSIHRSVLAESTTDMSVSFKVEPSESTGTAKTASSASGMSGPETESETLLMSTMSPGQKTTLSEGKDTVTWDTQSHKFSSDPVTITYNKPTTDLPSAGSQAKVTGTLDSLVTNTTTIELTTEVTVAFVVSEVENPSQERSDSSSLQATVSKDIVWDQNATTPRALSRRTAETDLVATMVSESQGPSERVHMTTRPTIEDTASTMITTDAAATTRHALLSTSEATRTLTTKDTGPAGRPSFYSPTENTVSTVSEVSSKLEDSVYSKGQLVGIGVGITGAVIVLSILTIFLVVTYRRKRRNSCYITDHDLKDYRSLMKRQHEPQALASPSVAQSISPFVDLFPEDVASNGPPVGKYRMVNFDRNSDDGLDGIEIVHDDSHAQRSPKAIPVEEYSLTPSGYSDCSYSVNTFRPDEGKSKNKSTDLVKSDAETKLDANEASGNDEKATKE